MNEVIIATQNEGKAKEFIHMFEGYGIKVKTLNDVAKDLDIEETGTTFEENAIIKAEEASKLFHTLVIADDSGLEIDALNGAPGVYSARYAGLEKNDDANMEKVLNELQGVPKEKRTARFCCCLAIAAPGLETKTVFGTCEGRILEEKRGHNGFGYDPIFFVEHLGRTMAELTKDEKSSVSHRGNALKKLAQQLPSILEVIEK
ncbi:nucleoside-triphosphate diphosphatase [Bacillus coahuilensis p1.1.43]|uniref:dITP/XTP pyrophosphatase n=1 Tax=Bacillus coahuilensis p1.1.43 TaxID=1150625 RepID=A0A147K741_9BACI|nr:XTP/dITP diphosphatase [Bacillus coahuilensis]KUP05903.1 nucleoside-triphosphate diphosphatase [Bacillus coahuilensis p1.1.43]